MVDRIREELGLQRDAGTFSVLHTALAGLIQEIARIKLDTGTIGMDCHFPAGVRIDQNGAGIAEDLIIVVIPPLEMQWLIGCLNIPANGLGLAEIHRTSFHIPQFAGGNILHIIRTEEPSGQDQFLRQGLLRHLMACQIKVAVVGQIQHRIPVALSVITDAELVAGFQGIGNIDGGLTREALVTLRTDQTQGDGSLTAANHIPHSPIKKVRPAVEVIFILIGDHPDPGIPQHKGGTLDPVGVSAHDCAQEAALSGVVTVGIIKAQHHIRHIAVFIRHQQRNQMCSVICNGCGQIAATECVKRCLSSIGQNAEIFMHRQNSSHFPKEKGYSGKYCVQVDYTIFSRAFQTFLFFCSCFWEHSAFSAVPGAARKTATFFFTKFTTQYFVFPSCKNHKM